jgi:hypothetical protein
MIEPNCVAYSAQNPFYNPIEYSPTHKADIDRAAASARRILTPHSLLLQMLLSRFQAIRYSQPALVHVILGIVLRSARAYLYLRYVSCWIIPVKAELRDKIALIHLQERTASRF